MSDQVNWPPPGAHRLAELGEHVVIGERTRIWQFASVIRGAIIGDDCTVGSCSIVDGAVVGDRVSIGHGAQLHPGTRIGNAVFIGPGVIFCNDAWPRVTKDGFDLDLLLSGKAPSVIVGNGVSIGAGVVILPGVKIGHGSMIAAGARVTKTVLPYSLHKRDGSIVAISPRAAARMRTAQ